MDFEIAANGGDGCEDTGGDVCFLDGSGAYDPDCASGTSICPFEGTYSGLTNTGAGTEYMYMNTVEASCVATTEASIDFIWGIVDNDHSGGSSREILNVSSAGGWVLKSWVNETVSPTADPYCSPNCVQFDFLCGSDQGATAFYIKSSFPYAVRYKVDMSGTYAVCEVTFDEYVSGDIGEGVIYNSGVMTSTGGNTGDVNNFWVRDETQDQEHVIDLVGWCNIGTTGDIGNQ